MPDNRSSNPELKTLGLAVGGIPNSVGVTDAALFIVDQGAVLSDTGEYQPAPWQVWFG